MTAKEFLDSIHKIVKEMQRKNITIDPALLLEQKNLIIKTNKEGTAVEEIKELN